MSDTPSTKPNAAAILLIAATAAAIGFAGGRTTARQEAQTALVYDASVPIAVPVEAPPVVLKQIATTQRIYGGTP